eukprot:TRINITY_DN5510_c0_g1_i2.p1 TRINITY_DN5510_c0_g1~~TRINITY_DN5510_c0_g1_i2.p1  ORF type:complete len:161 (-),score=31.15 TRINITY_DN5510_c0_g1_i2:28-510(-)
MTYVFPTAVRSAAITRTARGITTKQVLFGLESGQVFMAGKGLLDARRPSKTAITPQEREEGLVPYDPVVQINPRHVVNYYKKVHNLRKIETAPAYLESSSLVAAYGLDIFFTRVAPSGTFDVLNPDFNYFALIATSVVLIVLTVVSMRASKKADLAKAWR